MLDMENFSDMGLGTLGGSPLGALRAGEYVGLRPLLPHQFKRPPVQEFQQLDMLPIVPSSAEMEIAIVPEIEMAAAVPFDNELEIMLLLGYFVIAVARCDFLGLAFYPMLFNYLEINLKAKVAADVFNRHTSPPASAAP